MGEERDSDLSRLEELEEEIDDVGTGVSDISRPSDSSREGSQGSDTVGLATVIGANPAVHTTTLMMLVSIFSLGVAPGQVHPAFVAELPLFDPWYQPIVATYAHINLAHLTGNLVMVAAIGGIVSLWSSIIRFHLFFLGSSVIAIAGHLYINAWYGVPSGAIGASAGAFALLGYLITGNSPVRKALKQTSWAATVVVLVTLAGVLTIYLGSSGVAHLGHFFGAVVGLIAGRLDLLTPRD